MDRVQYNNILNLQRYYFIIVLLWSKLTMISLQGCGELDMIENKITPQIYYLKTVYDLVYHLHHLALTPLHHMI